MIKAKLAAKLGIPAYCQSLLHGTVVLFPNDVQMSTIGLSKGDELSLIRLSLTGLYNTSQTSGGVTPWHTTADVSADFDGAGSVSITIHEREMDPDSEDEGVFHVTNDFQARYIGKIEESQSGHFSIRTSKCELQGSHPGFEWIWPLRMEMAPNDNLVRLQVPCCWRWC